MNTMHLLGCQGDSETQWDPSDPESLHQAEQRFEEYRQARCLFFFAREPGGEAFHGREFDPHAREIIVTRPLIGG